MERRITMGQPTNRPPRPTAADTAALYARYSTDRQDSRSIEDQLRRVRALAESRDMRIVGQYTDAAVSGSHIDRVDLRRLLGDARNALFRSVIVDDLSRLSRDLGDTWRIVFEDLASLGIKVIDATTGMSSDSPGARVTFGALALVNDTFLQMVKTETHRGLEGRALKGFATGGRIYGYTTVQEENPPDVDHPRRVPIPHPTEAPLVRRIFQEYAAGKTYRDIAHALNAEGIPAPNDGGPKGHRGNKTAYGWGHTTIRAMLLNERYIGRWVWNQKRWVRVPGSKSRRALARPESEHVVTQQPDLQIISDDLWTHVRRRFGASSPGRGRVPGTGKFGATLMTGLLRCGVCGGACVVVSRLQKRGACYASFGCTVNRSRGATVCPNNRTISEKKLNRGVIEALKKKLTEPGLIERFRAGIVRRYQQLETNSAAADDVRALQRDVADAEARVKNVTAALAQIGFSTALAAQLTAEEARLAAARARQTQLAPRPRRRPVAQPRVVAAYLRHLLTVLETDKTAGRALLSRHMPRTVLTPNPTGPGYLITGGFDLALCFTSGGDTAEGLESPSAGSTLGMVAGA